MTLELTSLKLLRETVTAWRSAGESIALVPTMGALHRGHIALMEAAREKAQRVVVSIFVNPTQFGVNEDFDLYPRPRDNDIFMLAEEGADAAWMPMVEEMYPEGFATSIHVAGVSNGLDGVYRPGHFDGVATVVAKLLLQVMPDIALFGEKDYQQLCVIKRLVNDLNINTSIIGVPTVRDGNGLALSSRNKYLSEAERVIAPGLHCILQDLATQLKQPYSVIPPALRNSAEQLTKNQNRPDSQPAPPAKLGTHRRSQRDCERVVTLLEQARKQLLTAGFSKIDYINLCDADSLQPINEYQDNARLLVAAWLGKTRLIDNVKL